MKKSIEKVKQEILQLLELDGTQNYSWRKIDFEISQYEDQINLELGCQYESPIEPSLANSNKLAEYFGAKDVRWDRFDHPGCETCDYGSRYGYDIRIIGSKLNLDLKE